MCERLVSHMMPSLLVYGRSYLNMKQFLDVTNTYKNSRSKSQLLLIFTLYYIVTLLALCYQYAELGQTGKPPALS